MIKISSESVFIEKYLGKAHHRQWDVIVFVAIFKSPATKIAKIRSVIREFPDLPFKVNADFQ